MRGIVRIALAVWFAISTGMVQGCVGPSSGINSSNGKQSSGTPVGNSFTPGTYPAYPSTTKGTFTSTSASGSVDPGASAPDPDTTSGSVDTTGYTTDESDSQAVTAYLKSHRLPLVGAQVLHNAEGNRIIVLYGFVATDFGKSDAVTKARRALGASSVTVDNRIIVRPELLASGSSSSTAPASSAPSTPSQPENESASNQSYPGVSGYMNQQQNLGSAQQFAGGSSGSALSMVVPMIALLAILGAGMSTGGSSSFGGFGGSYGPPSLSPFGAPPYNPYPGYPSPGYSYPPPGYSYPPPAYPPYPSYP